MGGLTAISIGMDPDSVFSYTQTRIRLQSSDLSVPRHGALFQICFAEMATMRLHPAFYRPVAKPIGHTTPKRPRPLDFYWLFTTSVKMTTPLDTETLQPAIHVAYSQDFPVRQISCTTLLVHPSTAFKIYCMQLAPPLLSLQKARARKPACSISYYITSTCWERRRVLVKAAVTRAFRVNTMKPIGCCIQSRVPSKSQGLLPTSVVLNSTSAFFYLRETKHSRHL